MSEWKRWCKDADDFSVRGATIDVALPDGRRHLVDVDANDREVRLTGRVASRGALSRLERPELWVWKRNRVVPLVALRIDRYDALIGELVVPVAGIDANEFQGFVRLLAAECDRVEFLLTGEDVS